MRSAAPRLLVPLVLLLAGCQAPAPEPDRSTIRFEVRDPFEGSGWLDLPSGDFWDVLLTDIDTDGDPDVFFNWHLSGLEVFRNDGDRMTLLHPDGLDYQPGVSSLFVGQERMTAIVSEQSPDGIVVWHDPTVLTRWQIHLPAGTASPLSLRIWCNETITNLEGVAEDEIVSQTTEEVVLSLNVTRSRTLAVTHDYIAGNLRITQESLPYFVGENLEPHPGPVLDLWKPDPHGVAWVDADGDDLPDLFVVRGGNRGTLAPPESPKTHRFYWGAEGAYRMAPSRTVPPDFARGRSSAWVDIDNDGDAELYIGNYHGPNRLYALKGRAFRLKTLRGLHMTCGDVFTWFDVDEDGWDDLVARCGQQILIHRNRKGRRFPKVKGSKLGLSLPEVPPASAFDTLTLTPVDFDGDGRLDLWMSGVGRGRAHRVFRNTGGGFEDVTAQLGVAKLGGAQGIVPFDADADGWLDVLHVSEVPRLLHNLQGQRFEVLDAGAWLEGDPGPVRAAAAADLDGDSRLDLVLMGERRRIAINRSAPANSSLTVRLDPSGRRAIGTLVRVTWDDGVRQVQRYGSTDGSGVSQATLPLSFGRADAIASVDVRRPGRVRWQPVPFSRSDRELVVALGPSRATATRAGSSR